MNPANLTKRIIYFYHYKPRYMIYIINDIFTRWNFANFLNRFTFLSAIILDFFLKKV